MEGGFERLLKLSSCWYEPCFVFFGDLTRSTVNGLEHYVVFSSIKLKASDPANLEPVASKQAWKQIRFEQSGLAVVVDSKDRTIHYEVPIKKVSSNGLQIRSLFSMIVHVPMMPTPILSRS